MDNRAVKMAPERTRETRNAEHELCDAASILMIAARRTNECSVKHSQSSSKNKSAWRWDGFTASLAAKETQVPCKQSGGKTSRAKAKCYLVVGHDSNNVPESYHLETELRAVRERDLGVQSKAVPTPGQS
jgi:hypothetical protein